MGESAPRAIGHIRVSTDEQATEGISLDVQKDRIIR
jgi:DNA invertase Pin-like site-specific DNA recombinase